MRQTVSRGSSGWRRTLPWFGIGAAVVTALVVFVASLLAPDSAAWWVAVLAIGGLVAGVTLEYLAGRALETWGMRRENAGRARRLEARVPKGPATLLSARRAAEIGLPLLGREAQMAELLGWCTASPGRPFRLITGPGGVGKTRLADELQRRLRTSDQRWECLFLAADQDTDPGAVATLREHAGDRPVLVVLDYAENRPGLLAFLVNAFEDTGTLRVLLLARQAGNWWDKLTDIPGGLGDALQAGYMDRDLPDVEASPRAVVDNAASAFAAHLEVPVPMVPFEATGGLRVLDLTAIALVAVLDTMKNPEQVPPTGPIEAGEVFTELLRHEADGYWQATVREIGLEDTLTVAMRRVLVAAVALLGVTDQPSVVVLATRVLSTFADDAPPDAAAAARWLRRTYPAAHEASNWVDPLLPDRVAEHLVVQVLTVGPHPVVRRVEALLENLSVDQAVQAMSVLSRAAGDPARNHDERVSVRALADHLADHLPPHPPTVARVLDAIPAPSVTMSRTAVRLARTHLDLLDDAPEADEREIADAAHRLGDLLSELAQRDEALQAAQRAVGLYERLAQADPDRHEPALAMSLTRLGYRFSDLGQLDKGLAPTQRAVDLYERLAQADPDRHEPDLAMSLDNLGFRFSQLGRPEAGLSPTQRAVDLYERLTQANPGRHEPDLAMSLVNLGYRFSRLGRPDEALLVAQRAVDLYERLAGANPDRHEPALSHALVSLASWFAEVGRPEEALLAAQRAVEIRERLTRTNPDRYEPYLSSALNSLGAQLAELGRPEEALPVTQRAVEIRERLTRTNPDRYEPYLSSTLNSLGARLAELGRPEEALPVTQRAVETCERSARAYPDRYEPDLAWALDNLGHRFAELNRPTEAVPVVERAVDLYERVARRNPARYQADHDRARVFLDELRRDSE